jgi:hypothetical protein
MGHGPGDYPDCCNNNSGTDLREEGPWIRTTTVVEIKFSVFPMYATE